MPSEQENTKELSELDLLRNIDEKLNRQLNLGIGTHLVRGIVNGFGFALGTTVLLGLMVLILRQFVSIPLIGEFVRQVVEVVETRGNNIIQSPKDISISGEEDIEGIELDFESSEK